MVATSSEWAQSASHKRSCDSTATLSYVRVWDNKHCCNVALLLPPMGPHCGQPSAAVGTRHVDRRTKTPFRVEWNSGNLKELSPAPTALGTAIPRCSWQRRDPSNNPAGTVMSIRQEKEGGRKVRRVGGGAPYAPQAGMGTPILYTCGYGSRSDTGKNPQQISQKTTLASFSALANPQDYLRRLSRIARGRRVMVRRQEIFLPHIKGKSRRYRSGGLMYQTITRGYPSFALVSIHSVRRMLSTSLSPFPSI